MVDVVVVLGASVVVGGSVVVVVRVVVVGASVVVVVEGTDDVVAGNKVVVVCEGSDALVGVEPDVVDTVPLALATVVPVDVNGSLASTSTLVEESRLSTKVDSEVPVEPSTATTTAARTPMASRLTRMDLAASFMGSPAGGTFLTHSPCRRLAPSIVSDQRS